MDILNYDYITVTGKIQAADHIIERYGDFGWQLTERKDDKLYCDVTHMSFTRPHKMEHKDELQLLQVRLEIAYNTAGKYAHKISQRATLLGNAVGLLAAGFTVSGVVLLLLVGGLVSLICGPVLMVTGVVCGVVGALISYKLYKKDKKKYAALIKAENEKIDALCSKAKRLRGADE